MLRIILFFVFAISVKSLFAQGFGLEQNSFNTKFGFVENKGQIIDQNSQPNPAVKYLCTMPGLQVQLRDQGYSYEVKKEIRREAAPKISGSKGYESSDKVTYSIHRVDVQFEGANQRMVWEASAPQEGYSNYYTAGTTEVGVLEVRTYRHLIARNVWDNIDIEFLAAEEDKQPIKYNVILRPGANLAKVRLRVVGADAAHISEAGRLLLKTAYGDLEESVPFSYVEQSGQANRENIEVRFRALGENVFGFQLPAGFSVEGKTLVIDPTPDRAWGTFYGGSENDHAYACKVDGGGNLYATGRTLSTNNIATSGAFQSSYGLNADAFLCKFNSTGVRQWATYYGGGATEEGLSCSLDNSAANIYMSGFTTSNNNVASSGSHQSTNGGAEDAFLVKFNSNGARQWGTFYGGSGNDRGLACSADANGNIILTGFTTSNNNISTPGAHQISLAGNKNAMVVKFNANGARQWGTYVGGDEGRDCAVDASGNVFITGLATSLTGISTAGAHQPNIGSTFDGFLMKLNTSGARQWGTYYGGAGDDWAESCAVDAAGNVLIFGRTNSSSGIATPGAYQTSFLGSNFDTFVAKFGTNGIRSWGTYYGGSGGYTICLKGIVDAGNNIYFTGYSDAKNIASAGAYQTGKGGAGDAFLVKLNSSGARQWGTYYGGSFLDKGYGCGLDNNGNIYLCGETASSSAMSSVGSHQTALGGGWDGFLAKFTQSSCTISTSISTSTPTCASQSNGSATVTATGGTTPYTYKWSNNQTTQTATNLAAGTYTVTVTSANGCSATATASITTASGLAVSVSTVGSCSGQPNGSATLTASGGTTPYTYKWSNNQTTQTATNLAAGTYTATVTSANGCSATATASITTASGPVLSLSIVGSCSGQPNGSATVTASSGTTPYTYKWSNNQTTQTATNLAAGTYTVTVTSANGCSATTTASITTASGPVLSLSIVGSCSGQSNGSVTVTATGGTTPYTYIWSNNQTTATIINLVPGIYTVTVKSNNGCTTTATATVANFSGGVDCGLIVRYKFSNTLNDETINANNGAAPNGVTYTDDKFGNCKQAAKFNGINTYISVPSSASLESPVGGITLMGWAKSALPTAGLYSLISKVVPGTLNLHYRLGIGPDKKMFFGFNANSDRTATITDPNFSITNWNHYAVSWDGSSARFYLNGVKIGNDVPFIGIIQPTPSAPLEFGRDAHGPIEYLNGDLDELRIYNRPLSATEILQLVNTTGDTPLSASVSAPAPVCSGLSNGSATVAATGGTMPYTYKWSNNQTTQTATNLVAGTYTVTVTSANSCSATATANITTTPAPTLSTSGTGSCVGQSNGSAIVNATGGIAPYSYTWSNNQTTATATNLTPGTYTVTVKGNNNCSATATATVNTNNPPIATANPVGACANQANGSIGIYFSSGTPPYQYSWSNGQTGNPAVNLTIGTYTVTITGNNGCSTTLSTTVPLSQTTVQLAVPDGPANGSAGNTATYSILPVPGAEYYIWSPPPGCSINGGMPGEAVTLPAVSGTSISLIFGCGWGDLCVQATGSCVKSIPTCKSINCYGPQYKDIPLCSSNTLGADDLAESCIYTRIDGLTGSNEGYTAGPGPIGFCGIEHSGVWYGFVANTVATTFVLTPISTETADGLQLALTDHNGQTIACDTGKIGNYPNPNIVSANNLVPGNVYYLFVDGYNGDACNFTITTIPSVNGYSLPTLGDISAVQGPSNACPGQSIVLRVPPVANATQYIWQGSPGTAINGALLPLTLDTSGHTVTVTLPNTSSIISVQAVNICQLSKLVSKSIVVNSPNTTFPPVTVCYEDLPYTLPWGDQVAGSGIYQIILITPKGCDSIIQQQVKVLPPIIVSLPNIEICSAFLPYTLPWGDKIVNSGVYQKMLTSWRGCDSTIRVSVMVVPNPVAEIKGSPVICANGSATLYSGSSVPSTIKTWKNANGQIIGNGNDLIVTAPGVYILAVQEMVSSLQCLSYDTILVATSNEPPPNITAFGGNLDCTNSMLTIGASSSTPNATYVWSGPMGFTATKQFANVTQQGIYTVTVTAPSGCTNATTTTVGFVGFGINLQSNPETGGQTCSVTATPTGGTPPYQYLWSNAQTTQTASGLPNGNYMVTITDATACSSTGTGTCLTVNTQDLEGVEAFDIAPNPANTYLTAHIKMARPSNLRMQLFNAVGQNVFDAVQYTNNWDENINVESLPSGCYFFKISTPTGVRSKIISIIH